MNPTFWEWHTKIKVCSKMATKTEVIWFESERESHSVVSESLQPHGLYIQFSSVTQSCPTLCDPIDCSTPGLPVHHRLREFTQTHVHWVGDAIQSSHPLSSPSPPALIFPSIKVFSSKSFLRIRWPKDGSFSFSISPSNEHSGLFSFRVCWICLQSKGLSRVFSNTTVQRINSLVLSFFIVQLSHP